MHYFIKSPRIASYVSISLILVLSFYSRVVAQEVLQTDTLEKVSTSYETKLDHILSSENHPAILDFLDSLREEGHYNPHLSWYYARSLFQAGRLDAARDSLLLWEEDSVNRTRADNMLVQIAVQQRNHLEAIKYLIRLRDRYPDNPVYPYRLARVFSASNQLLAAEGQYARAYRLDTLNQLVIGEWADVLQNLGFTQRAYRMLARGITISPDNLGFRRQMVGLAYELKNLEEVIDHGVYLTEQGDTTAQIVKIKGFAWFQLGRIKKAEYWIDYLLDNQLFGEDVFFYKGRILAAKGDKIGAQEYFYEATYSCLSPNFYSFALQSGINLYETKKYADAIRWFQMMRNFSPNPMITFYLASSYFEYYEDSDPAYRQFRLFLEQSTREDQEIYREYAMNRLREITEDRHFRGE